MGRPARNYGGTLGHGCLPLPGVRPNYNHHVISDKTLQRLVQTTNKKPGKSTKLEILENLPKSGPSDKPSDYVSTKEPKRDHADKPSVCVNIKNHHGDQQVDSVCSKEPEGVQIDIPSKSASTKEPRKVQADRPRDSVNIKDSKRVQGDRSADSDNPMDPDTDNPSGLTSIRQSRKVPNNKTRESTIIKNPRSVYRNRSNESVKGVHIDSTSDSANINVPSEVQAYKQIDSFDIKNPMRAHDDRSKDPVNLKNPMGAHDDRSKDSVNDKEAGRVHIDRPGDSSCIREPFQVQNDRPWESVNIDTNTTPNLAQSDSQYDCVRIQDHRSALMDRSSDSVNFCELKVIGIGSPSDSAINKEHIRVQADRARDSVNFHGAVEKSSLPVTALSVPGSSVAMPMREPFQSNEIPGASRDHLNDPIVLPATSEQIETECSQEESVHVLVKFGNSSIKLELNKEKDILELRKSFCQAEKLKLSSVRFLLNGQRLEDDEKIKSLSTGDGDVIEAFLELAGGGKPKYVKNLVEEKDIRNALDESYEFSDELDSGSDNEHPKEDVPLLGEITEKIVTNNNEKSQSQNDNYLKDLENEKSSEDNITDKDVAVDSDCTNEIEVELACRQFLENVRQNGVFLRNKPLDKKIIQLLELPNISVIEIGILKNYLEMREKLEELSQEDEEPERHKKKRKMKKEEAATMERNLRRKTEGEKGNEKQEKKGYTEVHDSEEDIHQTPQKTNPEVPNHETPKQRNKMLNLFGIGTPSPFLKFSKTTEEDLKRLSVAVHLWAHKWVGNMKILQEERLTDKHFQQILEFAGPNSKWHILKDRPVSQYKKMWRNAMKGKHYYRGHPESGYETESKLHCPDIPFCPFQHCKPGLMSPFDVDLTVLTPLQKNNQPNERILASTQRRLFTPQKDTEKEASEDNLMNIQDPGNPTPKKQELMRQNQVLKNELQKMKMKDDHNEKSLEVTENSSPSKAILVTCNVENCGREFTTTFGLSKHQRNEHGDENVDQNTKHQCCFCGKSVRYIDQHINIVHKDLRPNNKCQVCQKIILGDMKKHRGSCNSCPYCPHTEKKKARLLKHIAACIYKKEASTSQIEPWDLSSPKKGDTKETNDFVATAAESHSAVQGENFSILTDPSALDQAVEDHEGGLEINLPSNFSQEPNLVKGIAKRVPNKGGKDEEGPEKSIEREKVKVKNVSEISTKQNRLKYPFDQDESDESYMSEVEENDEIEFTLERRRVKDNLELELRMVDSMENPEQEGDDEVVSKFRNFMQIKKRKAQKEGEFSKLKQVSTVDMYTNAVKNCLIPAFHLLVTPFDARWILDCTTAKQVTINGEPRRFVKPEEPVYMTSFILKEALRKIDSYSGESGSERGTLLCATTDFLDFIELEFNNKMSSCGPGPSEKLWPYHNGVRKFLKSTGEWKISNQEKDKAHQTKKVLEQYENPNKDLQILENYNNYKSSSERLSKFTRVLRFAADDSPLPSNGEMTELGQIVMGEVVLATGVRPIVVTRLTMASYGDKMPGFNPREISKDDCVVEEEQDDHKIFRRVNPSLPPKDKACEHQAAEKTAFCSVHCENRCDPDGYNIQVNWDKTHSTNGSSYLHLTRPLKVLMDCYSLIRSRFFQHRKPSFTQNDEWLSEDETPFFIKSSCSEFKFLDLKHISEAMKCDVTAYDFRRIVCTWALTHDNHEIREAEEEALQHRLQVAKDRYLQNKQSKPQNLTQTYAQEENLFPKQIMEEVDKTEAAHIKEMKENDEKRAKKRYANLVNEKEAYKRSKLENKPLGPKHRVVESDRIRFKELVEEVQNRTIESLLVEMKPTQWRRFIVRLVCTTEGQKGIELRTLWVKLYKGDLKWGVRDARMRFKEKISGKNQLPDRNSWISTSIRSSLISERKRNTRKSYLKSV